MMKVLIDEPDVIDELLSDERFECENALGVKNVKEGKRVLW